MMANSEETTPVHLPRLSNDNQLKIFKLVKDGYVNIGSVILVALFDL